MAVLEQAERKNPPCESGEEGLNLPIACQSTCIYEAFCPRLCRSDLLGWSVSSQQPPTNDAPIALKFLRQGSFPENLERNQSPGGASPHVVSCRIAVQRSHPLSASRKQQDAARLSSEMFVVLRLPTCKKQTASSAVLPSSPRIVHLVASCYSQPSRARIIWIDEERLLFASISTLIPLGAARPGSLVIWSLALCPLEITLDCLMAISKIGNDNLYVGGFMSLSNSLALKNANITHVVTVMRGGADKDRFKTFKHHLHIAVDDMSDEDLLQHFPITNAFVRSGLEEGGGVLIHCAMGKSRSAAVCIAFLLHRDPTAMDPHGVLAILRQSRQMCEPNPGFMEQLLLYHQMGCPENVTDHPLYQRWLYQRAVEESVACGRGPELDEIRFEDQAADGTEENDKATEVRCRKCR
ncbi:conserved hypothetical protein [Uncinocarpus reesii 1704]|uniref:protein-tyrosine-phosphatase n=1 Tax=Uncinocarpus reesii (strain UAMH 1704) TaxID=336963 RepID=C4JSZ6_UNCRE|nr:uncharacterized protein UREG_05585 [Uncinocarpus reesii 1704]EEP80743.1 conserved hypothetical protein [Uncinocarpus reesii 1704]